MTNYAYQFESVWGVVNPVLLKTGVVDAIALGVRAGSALGVNK